MVTITIAALCFLNLALFEVMVHPTTFHISCPLYMQLSYAKNIGISNIAMEDVCTLSLENTCTPLILVLAWFLA